ncbi:DUF481 domain-containing protein [Massilia glaciei]|uniref:DUF481 domain-containing protein n=2 Tax=Massilia glaciei TaxID=1524097 RepID=A0A2U2HPQ6_9BURK|nr:DUF481 domain-containing protein [Massilia glaciei]
MVEKFLLTLVLGVAACGAALAVEVERPGWTTSAELGAIITSGNTVGTSVTGKIEARHELAGWSNHYVMGGYFKEDEAADGQGGRLRKRSAERYSFSAKAAFKLMQKGKKLFVLASHVDDKFAAYSTYSSVGVGHSVQLHASADRSLDVELGPGYFSGVNANGQAESGFTLRGAAALKWKLGPAAVFSQTLSVERGASNTHSVAEFGLSTKINDTMRMKASFVARKDTNVPAKKKNTDTQTALTLVYSF